MGRRIGRIVLNGLTALSLLLCVGTVALWVRSTYQAEWFQYLWWPEGEPEPNDLLSFNHKAHTYILQTEAGALRFGAFDCYLAPWESDYHWHGWRHQSAPAGQARWNLLPHRVPYWTVCGGLLVLPGIKLMTRRDGPRPGLCPRCRYDLTGNVSGVCPECGTPVSPAAPGERMGKPAREGGEVPEGPSGE